MDISSWKIRGLVIASVLLAGTGARAEDAAEILAIVDQNLTKVADQMYDAEVQVVRDGRVTKTLKFTAKLKGLRAKLVRFTAPGDVRGMAVLTTLEGHTYVYLPSYKRVRRVAAHVKNQGFMGTDFSPDDFGASALSIGWHARLLSDDQEIWVLELTPEEGNRTEYRKMVVTVSKKHQGVEKIESYGRRNALVKTQIRSEWKTFGPLTVPTLFTVTDHRTGSKTVMRFFDCTVNQGIPDSAFTRRAIMRAN